MKSSLKKLAALLRQPKISEFSDLVAIALITMSTRPRNGALVQKFSSDSKTALKKIISGLIENRFESEEGDSVLAAFNLLIEDEIFFGRLVKVTTESLFSGRHIASDVIVTMIENIAIVAQVESMKSKYNEATIVC